MQTHARPFRNFPSRWSGCAPAPHAGWKSGGEVNDLPIRPTCQACRPFGAPPRRRVPLGSSQCARGRRSPGSRRWRRRGEESLRRRSVKENTLVCVPNFVDLCVRLRSYPLREILPGSRVGIHAREQRSLSSPAISAPRCAQPCPWHFDGLQTRNPPRMLHRCPSIRPFQTFPRCAPQPASISPIVALGDQ